MRWSGNIALMESSKGLERYFTCAALICKVGNRCWFARVKILSNSEQMCCSQSFKSQPLALRPRAITPPVLYALVVVKER